MILRRGEIEPPREKEGTTQIDFYLGRHSNRFAGKGKGRLKETGEELEFDDSEDLTPAGKARAKEIGGEMFSDYDYVVGVGSMEARTAETAEDIKKGADKEKGLGSNRFFGVTFKDLSGTNSELIKTTIRPIIQKAAAEHPNYGGLNPEERAVVRQSTQEKGLNEGMKNEELVEEFAEGLAYTVQALREMSNQAHDGTPGLRSALPIVTHGGYNESFLLKVLLVDGKKGIIKDVDDLGGFFAPAEFFKVVVKKTSGQEEVNCEFTNPSRQKLFTGKKLSIDWKEVKSLADLYAQRLETLEYQDKLRKQVSTVSKEQ